MSRLFDRQIAVTIGKPVPGDYFAVQGNVITVRNLRVTFDIEKEIGSEPNKCEVVIYNLNDSTRAELQRKPLHILLEAGYDGEIKRLFSGDLRWSNTDGEGVDAPTTLQLGDGERSIAHAQVNRSYRGGVSSQDCLREIARAMGVEVPRNYKASRALSSQFANGVALSGRASDELTRVLNRHNLTWSIQDGRLQILGENESRNEAAFVISRETGMIGSPKYNAPEKPGKAPVLTLKTLLYPALTPGGRIKVVSKYVNGVFRIERIRHSGDTRGTEWYTEIEAKTHINTPGEGVEEAP